MTIAQIDSGVAQRPELTALVASVDFVGTYDPSFAAGTSVDPHGHGTHVAGILVGDGTHSANGRLVGIAPEASLVSVRVLEQRGSGHELEPAGGPAVGSRPQEPVRHPRPQPVARTSGLRAARRRSAGAGGGRAVGCGHRGRVLGRQRRPAGPRHDQQPLQLAQGHHRRSAQRPQDRTASWTTPWPATPGVGRRGSISSPSPTCSRRGTDLVDALPGVHLDVQLPLSRIAGDPTGSGKELLRAVGYEHGRADGLGSGRTPAGAGSDAEPGFREGAAHAVGAEGFRRGSLRHRRGRLDIEGALHTPGLVQQALSPLVIVGGSDPSDPTSSGVLRFENTAVLWGDAAFSLATLWGEAVLWAESTARTWSRTARSCPSSARTRLCGRSLGRGHALAGRHAVAGEHALGRGRALARSTSTWR